MNGVNIIATDSMDALRCLSADAGLDFVSFEKTYTSFDGWNGIIPAFSDLMTDIKSDVTVHAPPLWDWRTGLNTADGRKYDGNPTYMTIRQYYLRDGLRHSTRPISMDDLRVPTRSSRL